MKKYFVSALAVALSLFAVPASATDFGLGGIHIGGSGTLTGGGVVGNKTGNVKIKASNKNKANASLNQQVGTKGVKINSKIDTGSKSTSSTSLKGPGAGYAASGGFGLGANVGGIAAGIR